MPKFDICIIGAGIAGLSAAIHLQNEGLAVKVIEASDDIGGRVRTDKKDGYLLDYGFQVLLTAYPEAQRMLNYNALQLKHFYPGALIFYKGAFHRFTDPFRKPLTALNTLFAPLTNFADKIKILALRNRHKRLAIPQIFQESEQSTIHYLRDWHFSSQIINTFFRPFLGGIFLDARLQTSSRMFEFVMKMFAEGYAALPAEGMQAIPQQLYQKLLPDTVQLLTKAVAVEQGKVTLQDGETIDTRAILLATDVSAIQKLVPDYQGVTKTNATQCLYFSADKSPVKEPILILNGEDSLVNNISVPSMINPSYAPARKQLISVSVIKETDLREEALMFAVKKELLSMFGTQVHYWEHLHTYDIPNALPQKTSIELPDKSAIQPIRKGIYVCGDHVYHASLQGAMESARHTANAISWDLALGKT